jgi:transposase
MQDDMLSVQPEFLQQNFQTCKQEIKHLEEAEGAGIDDLNYFDESGFSSVPEIPYAWQEPDDRILLPSARNQRLNVLGFLNRRNDFMFYIFECSVNSDVVVACFDDFAQSLKKPTVVFIDNAPTHHSDVFTDNIERWAKNGLYIYNIPAYSTELNKIEILWRMIKYYWLPFEVYCNFESLRNCLEKTLIKVGSKYKITFA